MHSWCEFYIFDNNTESVLPEILYILTSNNDDFEFIYETVDYKCINYYCLRSQTTVKNTINRCIYDKQSYLTCNYIILLLLLYFVYLMIKYHKIVSSRITLN